MAVARGRSGSYAAAMPPRDRDGTVSEDIRLLGRLLGDVVRADAGPDVFELIERVRRLAVRERRGGAAPIAELAAELLPAGIAEQLHVIRAFAWISLLANTAEDVHHERARRLHQRDGAVPEDGSVAAVLDQLRARGVAAGEALAVLGELHVTPVLTAHPTEVRRGTVLDVLGRVADLLDERGRLEPADPDAPRSRRRCGWRSSASGRRRSSASRSSGCATRSTSRCATTTPASSGCCPNSTTTWPSSCSGAGATLSAPGRWSSGRSSRWGRGSAATATAIPS